MSSTVCLDSIRSYYKNKERVLNEFENKWAGCMGIIEARRGETSLIVVLKKLDYFRAAQKIQRCFRRFFKFIYPISKGLWIKWNMKDTGLYGSYGSYVRWITSPTYKDVRSSALGVRGWFNVFKRRDII